MSLFNRGEVYTIITDSETNFWVQKLAEGLCMEHTVIDVMSTGDHITISFRSKISRRRMNTILSMYRRNYNVQMGEYLTLITKK